MIRPQVPGLGLRPMSLATDDELRARGKLVEAERALEGHLKLRRCRANGGFHVHLRRPGRERAICGFGPSNRPGGRQMVERGYWSSWGFDGPTSCPHCHGILLDVMDVLGRGP